MKNLTLFYLAALLLTLLTCTPVINHEPTPLEDQQTEPLLADDIDPDAVLDRLGIVLPTVGAPVANYVNAVRTGDLLFLAGKGPRKADGSYITGKVGADLSLEQGNEAARLVAINQLAVLKAELGDLRKVKRIVKVLGMVNAVESFGDHPEVINGFSDLMVEVFGDRGKHARAAVGMGSLPRNTAVEIEMIVEVFPE